MEVDITQEFKDANGKYRTQSLFIEFRQEGFEPPFTLAREDKDGALSMYRLYMEIGDPTEYRVGTELLGSWEHWQLMARESGPQWFKVHLDKWRAELRAKLASEHFEDMKHTAKTAKTATERMAATKWLDQKINGKARQTRGRPSKDEIEGRLKQGLREADDIKQDLERLGL